MALLVIGATGTLGRQIVRQALNEGYNVRCLVRNIRKAGFLREWGAELVYGDLSTPETLPNSFKGITVVIDASTGRSTDNLNFKDIDWDGKIALLQAAKLANIKRFIFFSILNANKYSYIPLMKFKSNFEYILQNSSVPYTIFQLSGFFQGLIGQYALPILEQQPIYITNESLPVSYMDTEDIAKFCLKSLELQDTENQTFALGNPNSVLSSSIIKTCETLSGQKAITTQLPITGIKLGRQIMNLFEWTWNIGDRLSFVEVFSGSEEFKIDYAPIQKTFNIAPNELLTIENYLKQYFEQILTKLKDLNYSQEQTTKRRDLTF
uniref:Conserved hypothetical plastid protein Ycf39 n=1 Tax=Aureoumbra lagunensis TaxID=44058 RepID=C6KIZ0_9STRA|nr:conserved hypothetical plastid protein Ycf39 [Aureoumbra lagunensis]ACS36946.1 conserved hypothetical plastid protein Ycf39 [Aureoumbra lagunensis]